MNTKHERQLDCYEVSIFQTNLETHFKKGRINELNYNSLVKMQEILESVYPGKWDIRLKFSKILWLVHINTYGGNHNREIYKYKFIISSIDIIIHFPEITISNIKEESRILQDIYFKVSIDFIKDSYFYDCINNDPYEDNFQRIHPSEIYREFYINEELRGLRTTISTVEKLTGYVHSHLKPNRYHYQVFCLGTGEILMYMSNLNSGFDEDIFMGFIMQIKNFLEYESIEGVPYKYIGKIIDKEVVNNFDIIIANKFYKFFKENCTSEQLSILDWSYEGDKAVLIENSKLLSVVTENVKIFYDGKFLVNRGLDNKEYRINITSNTNLDQYLGVFDFDENIYFKEEKLRYTVIPETQIVLESVSDLVAPKAAVNKIKTELEKVVYEKRLDTHRNAKFNIVSDPQ